MEIHFYDSERYFPIDRKFYGGWTEVVEAIKSKTPRIDTIQMGVLSTTLFEYGYRIFVHPNNFNPYEIKLGANDCTDREIRMEHNLLKLWQAGEFY